MKERKEEEKIRKRKKKKNTCWRRNSSSMSWSTRPLAGVSLRRVRSSSRRNRFISFSYADNSACSE